MQNMLNQLDEAQYVEPKVVQGLEYPGTRSFNQNVNLDRSLIGDPDASDEQYQKYMRDLDVDNAMDIARSENNEGTRKEVILPETFDIEGSERILSYFDDLDDLESEEIINNNTINRAVQDKIKQIELSNFQNQLRIDEITKTAMETNNILNYILWLLDALNLDIESIGDLIQEYKNLIVVLRKTRKIREAQLKDQGVNTDELAQDDIGTDTSDLVTREEEDLENYIEKYEILLSKYKDLVKIIRDHNINDLDLSLLQDILTRNKYSSQLILDNLNNSIDKIREYSADGLPDTQGPSNQDLDGKYNEKLFTSVYFIRKLADQLNIPEAELNSKYPIILLQGDNEVRIENERLNILATIEGLRLTADILSDSDNPEYNELTANIADSSPGELIQIINEIISELNTLVYSRTDQSVSPMVGGSLNIKLGVLEGGATYKENLKKLGREMVLTKLLSKDGKTLEEKIRSFSMTTPENDDFIKIKLRNDTLSKLLEISFKDFSFLDPKGLDESITTIDKAINDQDNTVLLQVWDSRKKNIKEFVKMSEKLAKYDFNSDNKLDKFLEKIRKLNDDADQTKSAKIYLSLILDLLKEKKDLKIIAKQANIDTIKYTTFIMKLSGAVRHFLLNKTDYKSGDSIETIDRIVSDKEIVDEFTDRATVDAEVQKAKEAVAELLRQIKIDKDPGLVNRETGIVDNRVPDIAVSPSRAVQAKMIIPPDGVGRAPTPRTLEEMQTPRPGAPNNSPRERPGARFANSEKASLRQSRVSIPKNADIGKVIKTLKKYKKTLEKYSVTQEQISEDVKISINEEQHKALDDKRETIMGQPGASPKEKSRALLNDVIVPTLQEIKPGAEIEGKLGNSLNLNEFTGLIKTSIDDDIDEFPDDMGFEGDSDVYIVSKILLPPPGAVAPIESLDNVQELDTPRSPPGSPPGSPPRSPPAALPFRPGTPSAKLEGDERKGFAQRITSALGKTIMRRTKQSNGGGKKSKTFKKKLINRTNK